MGNKKNGISIQSGHDTKIDGDVVGGEKITTYNSGFSAEDMVELIKQFAQIQKQIDQRPEDLQVDKAELKNLVENIEKEVNKGDEANPGKVERWLRFLAEMADDIFEVTASTLANPVAGVTKAIQLIAQKAKDKSAD